MARGDVVCSNFLGTARCHKPATHQFRRVRGAWRMVCTECMTVITRRASKLDRVAVRKLAKTAEK